MGKGRRTQPLPRTWPALRRMALRRAGHRCEWTTDDGIRCSVKATHVDHVVPAMDGGSDDPSNLQALCPPHHEAKTAREAGRARGVQKGTAAAKGKRAPELSPLERMMKDGSS